MSKFTLLFLSSSGSQRVEVLLDENTYNAIFVMGPGTISLEVSEDGELRQSKLLLQDG